MTQLPESPARCPPASGARVESHEHRPLEQGWEAASCSAGEHDGPEELERLSWRAARVPGTAAAALHDAGAWRLGQELDFDAEDWWFRTSFDWTAGATDEEVYLCLDGLATVAEVYLNGRLLLESDSMFAAHALDVGAHLSKRNELHIRCRALAPLLAERRGARARWRTRLASSGNLRFFRTMLLGRCPGIAPGPAVVGPWRPVRLERRRALDVTRLELSPRLEDGEGVLAVKVGLRSLAGTAARGVTLELHGPSGTHRVQLTPLQPHDTGESQASFGGELRITRVARWWPHTHGRAALYAARLHVDDRAGAIAIDAGRVGFRELAFAAGSDREPQHDGLDLHVNGVRVFARGAVWTPLDPVAMAPSREELRSELERVREAGMNMLRLPGTGAYECSAFYDLCDELGILVWQDFMFANFDYPFAEEHFRASVEREAEEVLRALAGRPSVTVLCGNSEVEQQAAMMGVEALAARGELFGELLRERVRAHGMDCLYIPSAPCGGDLPFRPGSGIGTYYGVGCYRLPLEDVRRADVRFAAECLAFSHVPDEATVAAMAPYAPELLVGNHPVWKAGIPRENGADWDFEDIRDHYLRLLFGVQADELRPVDHERYLELSRALTGELLAECYGEWRRTSSSCGGALILWLRDLWPGAGWGVIDAHGVPKLAYHHLKRALAPVAVWSIDEQLGGVVVHVANDRPQPLQARLRVVLYREREHPLEQATLPLELAPHGGGEWNVEQLIGRFYDASWSYRFGPPAFDAIVMTLERGAEQNREILSQAFRFPAGRPLQRERPEQLGLHARARTLPGGDMQLKLGTRRLAYGVHMHVPGFLPDDDGFSIEPGGERTVTLRAHNRDATSSGQLGTLGALNLSGRVRIPPTRSS